MTIVQSEAGVLHAVTALESSSCSQSIFMASSVLLLPTIGDDEPVTNLPDSEASLDDDTPPIEAVQESIPNSNSSNAETVPGVALVETATLPVPSDAEQWLPPPTTNHEPMAESNDWTLVNATIAPDGNVPEAVPLANASNSNDSNSRNRLLTLVMVAILAVALTIGLAVGLTRQPGPATIPSAPAPDTSSSKLTWISNSSIERVAKNLPNETVTVILADMNSTTALRWFEQVLWSSDSSFEPQTAQAKAWKWLVSNETVVEYTAEDAMARFALAVLYYQTEGAEWTRRDYWLDTSKHVCDWYWDWASSSFSMEECRNKGLVQFELQNNRVRGSLPLELGLLTTLSSLTLEGNQKGLFGSIPTSLCQLTRLERLSLRRNNLSGRLPEDFGALTKLTQLDLADNNFGGPFPLSMARLTLLKRFAISSLILSFDDFPHESILANWTNLQFLQIYGTATQGKGLKWGRFGPLPTTLGLLTQLSSLSLINLPLNGSLPDEMGNLTSLRKLFIFGGFIGGSLPTTFSLLTNLRELTMSNNLLSGSIPDAFWQGMGKLEYFDIGNNQLEGTLSTDIGLLTNLWYFSLGGLDMVGTIPTEIGLLWQLAYLDFHGNDFTGTIPSELANLYQLNWLNLDLEFLEGPVPSLICEMTQEPAVVLLVLIAQCDGPLDCSGCCAVDTPPTSFNGYTCDQY